MATQEAAAWSETEVTEIGTFCAGWAIGTTGGHADPNTGLRQDLQIEPGGDPVIINGPDQAWAAVRENFKQGVNVIKIMSTGGVLDLGDNADHVEMSEEEIADLQKS